jgi:hypothetical protein
MYELVGGKYDLVGADFSGDDEMMGFEWADIGAEGDDLESLLAASMGASVPSMSMRNPMARLAMAQKIARSRALMASRGPTKSREYPLGFGPITIPPGAVSVVPAQPQVPFRADRLVIPSDIAGGLLVQDVRVGKNSQFAAAGAVPARVFDERGVGVRLRGDTAQVSQIISISAQNVTLANIVFTAAIIGPAVE